MEAALKMAFGYLLVLLGFEIVHKQLNKEEATAKAQESDD